MKGLVNNSNLEILNRLCYLILMAQLLPNSDQDLATCFEKISSPRNHLKMILHAMAQDLEQLRKEKNQP
jgi:hypothetical protein